MGAAGVGILHTLRLSHVSSYSSISVIKLCRYFFVSMFFGISFLHKDSDVNYSERILFTEDFTH